MSCCSEKEISSVSQSCSTVKDKANTKDSESNCSEEDIKSSELVESSCCSGDNAETTSSCCNQEPTIESADSCCSSTEKLNSRCQETEGEENRTNELKNEEILKGSTKEYVIHGMDCPSCATTIEKSLQQNKSILDAKVSYTTEKLTLVVNRDYSEAKIDKTIQNLGFTIDSVESRNMHIYNVDGMDCGGCAKTIENHLIKIPGVYHVNVNFATGNMRVEHTNSIEDIIKEVSKIGFRASLQANKDTSNQKMHNNQEIIKVILSGILISSGFIGTYLGMSTLISTILFAIAIVISGYQPIKSAYYAIKSRSLDMNVLMSVAAVGAAIIGEWFEGATVVWLFSLGIYLQNRSMDQTRKSIRNLVNMAPTLAYVNIEGKLIEKPVEHITVGETIVIRPGDKIPLDGKIIQGESSINQAPITGESLPVDKMTGDSVYAGTMNESGSLNVEVTKLVEDTTLSKIIHLVEEAQEEKAPTEDFIDRFASIYTPIVFVLALFVMVLPPLFGFGLWGEWAYKGLALLVVACPCALVISTPVAIVSAIGNSAKNGVLIKGGTFLEIAGEIDALAFDKTGTLTEGKPSVSDIYPINTSEKSLLSVVYTLENHSSHPIAKTIVSYAKDRDIELLDGSNSKIIVGKGVSGTIAGEDYYVGNLTLFNDIGISFKHVQEQLQSLRQEGKTVVMVGNAKEVIGIIGVTDTIRSSTVNALKKLQDVGMEQIVMLTGDHDATAQKIAEQTNINRYFSELLPEDKVAALKKLQQENHKVAMVGDGINDAPALATADLGIAMGGTGTDTAMETADVVLMADNLEKLPYTVKLSRKALAIIKQNIWFSLIIKFAALILIFPGWLTLWMAVLSDTGAAIIVILNALRLLKVKD